MISLNSEQTCLLELIKASLFGIAPEIPEDANWEKIFEAAKVQCIVPLLASCVPVDYREKWNVITYQSKAHFMQMIYEQNALVKLLKDNTIPFVILKGTAAAIYYPNPFWRSFGDIDLYVSCNHLESVIELFKDGRFVFLSNDDRHFEFERNGIDVELHSKFSCEYYKDIDYIVLNGINNAVEYKIGDSSFCGLPAYENGLVLLGHIMQHLKGSGIGLRQIIDWMMFVYKELDDYAWDSHFRELAAEAGLEKLAISVTYMCKKWLGLPNDINWCNTADVGLADQLLIRILDDGNFGMDRAPFELVKKSMKDEGVFNYLQLAGLENWGLAQKFIIFRPFAWIYQLCRYICMGISNYFNGKKNFMKDRHRVSLDELWRELE